VPMCSTQSNSQSSASLEMIVPSYSRWVAVASQLLRAMCSRYQACRQEGAVHTASELQAKCVYKIEGMAGATLLRMQLARTSSSLHWWRSKGEMQAC
jgi:hypothetical protein